MNKFLLPITATALSVVFSMAQAATTQNLVPANKNIKGLDQVIDGASHASSIPVLFPKMIPAPKKMLFASFSSYGTKPDFNQFWQINAGSTNTCKGSHFCNVGYLSAQKEGKLETTYGGMMPNTKKEDKEVISLANDVKGYFTPGHAEGDFHPATMEWSMNNALYTLSWTTQNNEKIVLTEMANSALESSAATVKH